MAAPPFAGAPATIPLPHSSTPPVLDASGQPMPLDAAAEAVARAKAAALQTAPGTLNGPPSGNNHAIPLSARRAESLDLRTVERRGQANMAEERPKKNRLFGIPDAPTYRPTEEEFRDPMEYMRKIAPEGSKYGIVKIIPPDSWNPSFAIDTERFHFRTRRQELNSVEGGNRVNNDYLDQLAKFHKQNGHNLNRFPSVDKRPLDLYRLKKTVERKGGFEAVCKGKRWAEVGRDLGYSGKIMSSLSTSLKNSYQKWLLPYEEYLRLAKPGVQHQMEMMNGGPYTPSPGPSPAKKQYTNTPPGVKEETPTMRASAALYSSINGHSPHAPLRNSYEFPHSTTSAPQPQPPPAPSTGGFTAVNAGGFTAVNAPSVAPTPPTSFTSVNSANGGHHVNTAPTQRPVDTPPVGHAHPTLAPHPNGVSTLKRQYSDGILTQDEIDAMNRRSKRLRKDVPTVVGSNMHHSRMSAGRFQSPKDRGNWRPGELCENCGRAEDQLKFATCQSCECAYHVYCLEPPLKQIPDREWHCPKCLVGTNDYGFEEGDVYSLSGFQRKASDFKTNHFSRLPRQFSPFNESKHHLEEEDVEREFWRLVEDLSDATEVEYGADIHSTTHGSGFPTIEKQPRDPYSANPWNLNILPLDKESLFRHIKSDISGMTVPWLYVGMIFSTFCWHNEDHYTYSANYQHFGQTKTWYGIPAEDSYKFENAMREEVPELFEMQPDILFQLVTLAKPEKLRKAGVRVYAIDQRAGQFVITFPRAYHAGFNHGFNFNEAVNFAPHDWEPYGEEGVRRLRDYRKQPCFSHDELLITAAARDTTIRTLKWLAPALDRMRDEELEARKHFLQGPDAESGTASEEQYKGPRYEGLPDIIEPDANEEEVCCTFCKAYCYLSRYQCKKTGKYLCSLHAGGYECCDGLEHERFTGRDGTHRFALRMTDESLNALVQKALDRASVPETWAAKVDNLLDENPRPSLKQMKTLLAEGEKIQYELPQLADLKKFVERCNEWVVETNDYLSRKQANRRKNEKVWRKSTSNKVTDNDDREREYRKTENIQKLLNRADVLGFDCSEIDQLRERANNIAEWRRNANNALNNIRSKSTAEFEEMLVEGRDFHVDMQEIDSLERVMKRLRWDDKARTMRPNPETRRQDHTLKEVEQCIREGVELQVPESNADMMFLREHKAQGELWEQKAKELMAAEQVHYQQLDSLAKLVSSHAVNKETLEAVNAILKKQREIEEKITTLLEKSKDPDFRQRPMYKEMKDVMDSLEELQSKPKGTTDLENDRRRHEDWMRKGKKLFGKANAPLHILHQHMQLVEARNDACFEISDKPRMPVEPSSRHATPEDGAPISDGSNSSRDVFCICRRPEAGMMIECEVCHEWYHGKCLKIARGKVKEDDKYTCPVCDWRVKIPRDAARPKLEDLQQWQDELETLPFQPEEERTLFNIVDHAQTYRDYIRPIIHSEVPTTNEEVDTMRFHLRKIEGADILLAEETNFLRQELHKWAGIAPQPPPRIENSASTRKPRPTKQQKLMAQLGITNPDDLPQQYKIKQHMAKRKLSEAGTPIPPTLQPAGSSVSPSASQPPPAAVAAASASRTPTHTLSQTEKRFFTPLSLQVLEDLAAAPVVSKMLESEKFMNRDKLLKMKAILESDRRVWDDLKEFQRRMSTLPTPASHTPGFSFETAQERSRVVASTYQGQGQGSPLSLHSSDANASGSLPPANTNVLSPTRFASPADATPPPPPTFENNMFESGPHASSMFDSPGDTGKAAVLSVSTPPPPGPEFGSSRALFDSPKVPPGMGLHSPGGFDDSQGAGIMDNVFAEMVNDREQEQEGFGGLDGAGDVKDKEKASPLGVVGEGAVVPTTEGGDVTTVTAATAGENVAAAAGGKSEDVEMADVKAERNDDENAAVQGSG